MVKAKSKTTVSPAPLSDLLPPTTVSIDGGNGKFLLFRVKDGVVQRTILPNARVRVTGYEMGKEVMTLGTSSVQYADFLGERYGIGDGVWQQTTNAVETFSNSVMRYGSDYHVFMVLATLAVAGVETDAPLHLTISAPPGIVKDIAKPMKRAFKLGEEQDDSGRWTIKLGHERQARTYVINKVSVIPEGAGTYAAYAYTINGEPVAVTSSTGYNLLGGSVLVADGGMGTFDVFTIRDGNLSPESIAQATDGNFGISSLIIAPIRDAVVQMLRSKGITPPALYDPLIDSWLWRWAEAPLKSRRDLSTVAVSGVLLMLDDLFTKVINRAAEMVIAQKLEPQFRQGVDTVLATGGEWVYIGSHVMAAYPKRNILFPVNTPHLANVGLLDLNAYGGLVMAAIAARMKAAQP